jgi:hypothetical protein
MTDPQPGTAVATAPKTSVQLGSAQQDFDQLYRLCANLSKAQLLPKALIGKPADVLIIVMYGQELGLSPIQSLQGIYVVNGRPSLSGQLWLAKVREAGHKVDIAHADGSCTVTITRSDGASHSETFTLEDAKRAGLVGKDIWKSYPKRMLMWRALSDCATVICPEVALGFGMHEIEEDTRPTGPVLAEVVRNHRVDAELEQRRMEQMFSPEQVNAELARQAAATPPGTVHDIGEEDAVVVEHIPAPADPAAYAALAAEHTPPAAAPAAAPDDDYAAMEAEAAAAEAALAAAEGPVTSGIDETLFAQPAEGQQQPRRGRR